MTVLLAPNAYRSETTTDGPAHIQREVGLRGFPRSPRAPSSRYWGEPSNFERSRLVFPFTAFSGIFGTKFGKNEKFFQKDREPSRLGRRGDRRRGRPECCDFFRNRRKQSQRKSHP